MKGQVDRFTFDLAKIDLTGSSPDPARSSRVACTPVRHNLMSQGDSDHMILMTQQGDDSTSEITKNKSMLPHKVKKKPLGHMGIIVHFSPSLVQDGSMPYTQRGAPIDREKRVDQKQMTPVSTYLFNQV